jgi:glycosyltransferase involved in cell wall biosynthesis
MAMKSVPKLSVVMSVYNGLPFLRDAVESVLSQTYRDFEFIAIDDGSADDSWGVLSDYASRDGRMVLVRQEVNRGVAWARNRGFQVARGEYITCQDADDISLPERFARQVEYLDSQPAIGMLGTWPQFINEGGEPLDDVGFPRISRDKDIQGRLLDRNCFCAGSVMIRRSCLDIVGGYDQDLAPSEDYDLWLRLAEVTRLANVPACLYLYRQHPGSASRRRRYAQMRNKAIAVERALARRYSSDPPERLRNLLARDYLRAAYVGHITGAVPEACDSLERALEWSPRITVGGSLLEGVVWRYLRDEPADDAVRHAESLFGEFLPPTRHVRSVGSRLLSKVHMRVVFEAQERGEKRSDIGAHWWRGVRSDPRWLLNRGVWAIGLRQFMTRPNGVGGHKEP